MEEKSFLDRMLGHLRETCKYYTGYPKDLGPSRVIHFTSEREFVQLLHQGYPVVVAFTIRGNYTKHLDRVLEEAAAEFYPHVKVLRVECPKYPGFCITRQRKEYPFIEIFHSPQQVSLRKLVLSACSIDIAIQSCLTIIMVLLVQAANQGRVADPNITKYSVKVLPQGKVMYATMIPMSLWQAARRRLHLFFAANFAVGHKDKQAARLGLHLFLQPPFNYDQSAYGFREFFKRHGIRSSPDPK
ncbi:hypothetical protein POTOM_056577 [Populus tomentosa]|uniref:Thioredoxin superfamily protein n=1 Tax=Populus tomentosa TaxID=118781 RepID=A0A8X7Y362_POPTO|nr:hypothetical protein POTOM_056577 [Populus tomentosa]